ncbi:hypothetical protein T484DRAFT_1895532, partial [Baffinella frigidus]
MEVGPFGGRQRSSVEKEPGEQRRMAPRGGARSARTPLLGLVCIALSLLLLPRTANAAPIRFRVPFLQRRSGARPGKAAGGAGAVDTTGAGSARGIRDGAVGTDTALEQGGGGAFLQAEAEYDSGRGVGELAGGVVDGIARDLDPMVELEVFGGVEK